MAIALVQHTFADQTVATSTSIAKAFASNNTAGNLLIVIGSIQDTAPSCSDSAGNTYLTAVSRDTSGGFGYQRIFYCANCKSGANTVTLSYASSGTSDNVVISEWSGASTGTGVFDQSAGASTPNGTDANCGPVITTSNGQVVVGFCRAGSGSGVGAGWTTLDNPSSYTAEYQLQTVAGSITAVWTSASTGAESVMASFKPAPSCFVRQSTGTSTSVTLGAAAASGNFLIAFISAFRGAGVRTVSSIATTNTTWTKLAGTTNGGLSVEIWKGVVAGGSSGTAVTITMSGASSTLAVNISEFTGVTATLDGTAATNTGSSTAPTTGALTTASTFDLILACGGYANGTAPTALPGGNYENLVFVGNGSANGVQANYISGDYPPTTATLGAQSASWTITSAVWVSCIVALQLTAASIFPAYLQPRPVMAPLLVQ